MSYVGDLKETLKSKIKAYSGGNPQLLEVSVDTYFDVLTDNEMETEYFIEILEAGKGISSEGDFILERYIEQIKSWA